MSESREIIYVSVPGRTAIPWAHGAIDATVDPGLTVGSEIIDLERVSLPLFVRSAAAGDRFDPLGMEGQTMPLADFFRGRNVDRTHRPCVALVCDQIGIIWVVGHRIADRVKLGEQQGPADWG